MNGHEMISAFNADMLNSGVAVRKACALDALLEDRDKRSLDLAVGLPRVDSLGIRQEKHDVGLAIVDTNIQQEKHAVGLAGVHVVNS
mmetsp:Transcript_2958/g.6419  ORF Transcript_2958/g.6419 Transcript_2958/m.6419 type:complete len:87 (-) Transcript_2958:8218-8478(-)